MSEDSEVEKRQIEHMILDQLLDLLPIITGRAVTEEWEELPNRWRVPRIISSAWTANRSASS